MKEKNNDALRKSIPEFIRDDLTRGMAGGLPTKEVAGVKHEDPTEDELCEILRRRFPHGHDNFIPLSVGEMELHSRKNYDYASGGDPLGNFLRGAVALAQYPGLDLGDPTVYALVLMYKQLDAALWMLSNGHASKVEGIIERMKDVSVYSKIVCILEKRKKRGAVTDDEKAELP